MKFENDKKVATKVTIPKDMPWLILGAMQKDLGCNEDFETDTYCSNDYSAFTKRLNIIIRKRSVSDLMSLVAEFDARSIIEQTGSDNAKAYAFYMHYQLVSILKKFPFKGIDTAAPALLKFEEAEEHCKRFNNENYKALVALSENHPDYYGCIKRIKADIENLLGAVPDIDSVYGCAKHGPGVSLDDSYKGGKTTSFYKWSILPYSVTSGTLPYAKQAILSDPRWIGALDDWYRSRSNLPVGHPIDMDDFWFRVLKVQEYSRIATVPKTAVIDRTISIEPVLNVYLQLGVDHIVRTLLRKKWGYDLNDQQNNQELAREGSITDDLVTVDLSSASDLISRKINELFLPPAWYNLLLDLRTPAGVYKDQKAYIFEKLSSMGNGYTFAIESLIFAAISREAMRMAKVKGKSAVYGDDIIVPVAAYPHLIDLLTLCGFKVNEEKSFTEGPFRESCGKDFFEGHYVRPLFLTRQIKDVTDLFYVHNAFKILEENLPWVFGVDFKWTRELILKYIPKVYREKFYGPSSEALDTHLFTDRPLRRNNRRQRIYYRILPISTKYRCRSSDFFFRKLMVSLKQENSVSNNYLDKRRKEPDKGNAFDITKRGHLQRFCKRVTLP